MLRALINSLVRLFFGSNNKVPMICENDTSTRLWFTGFLGETRGIYSPQGYFKKCKPAYSGLVPDEYKPEIAMFPITEDLLLTTNTETLEDSQQPEN